ncbi:hypothetical protein UPYG_G00288120 [Umbra pygmaea]|uniref:DNA binding HTH domain-containing protein n=1 Tax=Umbra pygmaea TaxID=75934 RepID=A0ABD0W8X7_UMBPY
MASPGELAGIIERAVAAGVSAALRDLPTPSTSTETATTALPSLPAGNSSLSLSNSTSTTTSNDGDGHQNYVSKEDIESLLSFKTTLTEVASILCISRPTLYKLMREYNISTAKFTI